LASAKKALKSVSTISCKLIVQTQRVKWFHFLEIFTKCAMISSTTTVMATPMKTTASAEKTVLHKTLAVDVENSLESPGIPVVHATVELGDAINKER
jgi:hypothetical protein